MPLLLLLKELLVMSRLMVGVVLSARTSSVISCLALLCCGNAVLCCYAVMLVCCSDVMLGSAVLCDAVFMLADVTLRSKTHDQIKNGTHFFPPLSAMQSDSLLPSPSPTQCNQRHDHPSRLDPTIGVTLSFQPQLSKLDESPFCHQAR